MVSSLKPMQKEKVDADLRTQILHESIHSRRQIVYIWKLSFLSNT